MLLYEGVPFKANIMCYVYHFFLFSIYAFFLFGEFEDHVNNYGIYLIVRIRTKWSLIFRLIGKLCGSLFFLEIIRIITYVAFQYMESGSCQVGQVAEVIRMAALSYLTFLALFLIQMLLELRFNSKCALISSFSVYLLLVGVGSLLYTESHYSILNIVNLPNYLMYTRYLSLVKEYHLSYSGIMISIGSICVVLLLLMKCCLKKKDMI